MKRSAVTGLDLLGLALLLVCAYHVSTENTPPAAASATPAATAAGVFVLGLAALGRQLTRPGKRKRNLTAGRRHRPARQAPWRGTPRPAAVTVPA